MHKRGTPKRVFNLNLTQLAIVLRIIKVVLLKHRGLCSENQQVRQDSLTVNQ